MEHRCSVRLPVAMNVLLYHNNIPVVHCKTDDIGADGVFVRSGSLNYRTNSMLKMEFQTEKDNRRKSYILSAMVVHHAKNGLGLMFPGGDSEAMLAWRDVVRKTVLKNSIGQLEVLIKESELAILGSEKDDDQGQEKAFSIA